MLLILLIFIIAVLPNIYSGYFRPQLILLPFCLFLIAGFTMLKYFDFNRLNIVLTSIMLLFFFLQSERTMHYWEYAYKYSIEYLE